MKLTLPMSIAAGRHVMSFFGGVVMAAAAMHAISPDQSTTIMGALNQISSGVSNLVSGVATLLASLMAIYAAYSATPKAQAQALVSSVPGTTIVTDPAIASATPTQPSIVSNAVVQTVAKACLFLLLLPAIGMLAGCVGGPLDLTPQQQANLDKYIAAGKITLKATANLVCVFEPTTTALIRVFDPSNGTAAGTGKVDQATAILCNSALVKAGFAPTGG